MRHLITCALALCFSVTSSAAPAKAPAGKETSYKPKVSRYEKLPAVKRGGTMNYWIDGNPKVINPIIGQDTTSNWLLPYLFSTLFLEEEDNLDFIPNLAESWTVSADKKDYTFKLNKKAKWDDGTPITADDAQFTFDTMMNPKVDAAAKRAYWKGVTFSKVDDHTIRFHTDEPKFDTFRALTYFYIIQKKQYEGEKDFNKAKGILNPVGNGPYRLKSYSRDQKIELERVKDWWGYSLPYNKSRWSYDTIVMRVIDNEPLKYERWLNGDVDLILFRGPGVEIFKDRVRGTDKAKIAEKAPAPGAKPAGGKQLWADTFANKAPRGFEHLGWNLRLPIFRSKKTRQALAYLADIKDINEKAYAGFYYQSTSPFGSRTMNSAPELRQPGKMFSFDRKKGLALLKEDGWADTDGDGVIDKEIDGKRVPFKFTIGFNSTNTARGRVAQILKENYKAAGIEVTVKATEWNAYLSDMDARKFDAMTFGWTATPYPNPRQIWHSEAEKEAGSNYVGYSNPQVDALIEKANLEFDLKKRALVLHEINRILYDEQPYLWLVEPQALIMGVNARVRSPLWALEYGVYPATELYSAAP